MSLIFLFLCTILFCAFSAAEYKPDWSSIDSRPLPSWFDDSKLGIFTHWGVYSVPAFEDAWFWWYWQGEKKPEVLDFVAKHYGNRTAYADFAHEFTGEDFDADHYAEIVKSSGARYFVFTSKHCEGFTNWPSKYSWNWNSKDIGPHRDIVGELKHSIQKQGIHFGLYYSLYTWFHPLYISDPQRNRSEYVQTVVIPQLLEIVNEYQPDLIWSDGDWDRTVEYWKSREFIAWLYNKSPIKDKVVINDRWGQGAMGHHGGYMTHQDHYDPGVLQPRKWENCLTMDRYSWAFRRDLKEADVLSFKEIVTQLARTISCGGNMLLNIGPTREGRVIPIFEQRLRELGQFVSINDEAIFGTKPWIHQNDTDKIWYTSRVRDISIMNPNRLVNPQNEKNTIIYAFVIEIPHDNTLRLSSIVATDNTKVTMLSKEKFKFQIKKSGNVTVDLSQVPWQNWPSTECIVLKIEYAATSNFDPISSAKTNQEQARTNIFGFESSEEKSDNWGSFNPFTDTDHF
ncbi:alpha-L-fucosidase domain-containing protein [Ditylenchus destructor]|uniref:Putative alpha-L-fucosidase n=1 Tax=Ditylenchus destructor TaxID=166010 RepID=A0AAD4R1E7_9BILA|nr:alpha-L-fucosidase domain-containing protein [Ditylenchus destructor]